MRTRKRIDLKAVLQVDPRSGELWLHAGTRLSDIDRLTYQDPEFAKKITLERQRLLDELLSHGMLDAMQQYYIPVPPIQTREEIRQQPDFFSKDLLIERRVRMVKPTLVDTHPPENPQLAIGWILDPYPNRGWSTYIPEYDEEEDAPAKASPDARPQLPASGHEKEQARA